MNAKDAIHLVVEGAAPKGWATSRGVYGNFSNYPAEVTFYVKCPKCGLVHGTYKSLRDAHEKKLCDTCNVEVINKLKDEIQDVVHDPEHKPKEMAKLVGEAVDPPAPTFDPFDEPPEGEGQDLPAPDPDHPDLIDPKGEIDRLLMGNWVDVALRELSADLNIALVDIEIQTYQGDYDEDDPESTTHFTVDVGSEQHMLFKNEDEAESYALTLVRNDLEHEPEIFSQDWLRGFVDEDDLRNAIGDPHEDWENEVRDLDYEDLLDKMVEEGYVEDDDPVFFKKNGDKRVENPVRVKALDGYMESYIEREKPSWEPWDYLEEIYGREDAQKQALEMVGIDVDAAAKDAVATDGWQHFVARYNGNSTTLESGAVYCRIN